MNNIINLCSVRREPQQETPSDPVCANGHGGAELIVVADTIDAAARDWFAAKAAENRAKDERLAAEERLCKLATVKPEGSATTKTDAWKVTTTGKLNRKIDLEAFDAVAPTIPNELHPIKVKRELDDKGVAWLKENRPDVYAKIEPCITTEPAKTAVKCEPLAV